MFHIDVTAEDVRLIAFEMHYGDKTSLDVLLYASNGGPVHRIENVSFCDVEKLVSGMICCHGDVPAESYPHLEELLKNCPPECRPIP